MHNVDWRQLKTVHDRLQWARANAGYETPAEAAEALGMTGSRQSTYFGHENGSRGLARAGARYAEFFRVSYDWLMRGKGSPTPSLGRQSQTPAEVSILGLVGAGPEGEIQFSDGPPLGTAPFPPGGSDLSVAVEVRGNSMRPLVQEGWLVYYEDRRGALTPEMFGQPCIIGLASGHTVFKTPYPGSKKGLFNLESANPAVDTMRDQRVRWAALVTAIIPRRKAKTMGREVKGSVRS
jgi:hypothetical protein